MRYEEWIDNAPGLDRKLRSEHSNLDEGRWFLIQHTETGTRVLLRLQRQVRVYQSRMGEVRITGIVHLPFFAGDPVTSQLLRELPTAQIEAAINKRLFAMKRAADVHWRQDRPAQRPDDCRRATCSSLSATPQADPDFYERRRPPARPSHEQGDKNPSATIAQINGVALTTAQGWVAKARARGLLPPGRRGRAG